MLFIGSGTIIYMFQKEDVEDLYHVKTLYKQKNYTEMANKRNSLDPLILTEGAQFYLHPLNDRF